jgi:molybdate/tungstate transport system permease protein
MPNTPRFKLARYDPLMLFFSIIGAFAIVFIFLPIVMMYTTLDTGTFSKTLGNKDVWDGIFLSVSTAASATIIAIIFGVPLAYVMARKEFPGKSVIQGIIDLPIVVPHTVAGIALLTVFGRHGIIGAPLYEFNIRFVDAVPGIIVAMLFVSAPLLINSAREGFEAVNPKLENVALSLGASRKRMFFTISLPLCLRPIITGAIMSWARAISEFGAIIILVWFPKIATVVIYEAFLHDGIYSSKSIAVLLLTVCLVLFISLRLIVKHVKIKRKDRYRIPGNDRDNL